MRIDSSSTLPPAATPSSGPTNQSGAVGSTNREGTTSSPASGSDFSPTTDLTSLIRAVREMPEVRKDMVREAASRSAAGEMGTRAAALDTAVAMVESAEPYND